MIHLGLAEGDVPRFSAGTKLVDDPLIEATQVLCLLEPEPLNPSCPNVGAFNN